MNKLLNDMTAEWIKAYVNGPTAAVLIHTNDDSKTGKLIAEQIHKHVVADIKSPLIILQPTKKVSIGIEEVLEFQKILSLKANRSSGISRMAVVYQAEKLTPEAQNAMLKTIEELPASTLICLVVAQSDALLETIRSRCFTIPVLPFKNSKALDHALSRGVDEELANRSIAMSDGNLSLFIDYIDGKGDDSTDLAKQFFRSTVYERQIMLAKLQKTKNFDIQAFLQSLHLMCKIAMRRSSDPNTKQAWKNRLKLIIESEDMLRRNVISKLVLLRLSIFI